MFLLLSYSGRHHPVDGSAALWGGGKGGVGRGEADCRPVSSSLRGVVVVAWWSGRTLRVGGIRKSA